MWNAGITGSTKEKSRMVRKGSVFQPKQKELIPTNPIYPCEELKVLNKL
jgi:hypothetical protein